MAKRYYAAFPPLSRNTSSSSPSSYIALIPKWPGSPKKKAKRQTRSSSYEDKFHCKIDTDMKPKSLGKQRYTYFSKNKRELGYCRNVAKSMERSESMNDWDLYMFKSNLKGMASNNWPKLTKGPLTEKDITPSVLSNLSETAFSQGSTDELWTDNDDNVNMYDDLPVDIRQLLNSPVQSLDNVEMMNMANMRDTGKKTTFLSCGFNIGNSIWSNEIATPEDMTTFDNKYNSAIDDDNSNQQTEEILDLKFSSISIDNARSNWSNMDATVDNEKNIFYENLNDTSFTNKMNFDNAWLKITAQKWSDGEGELELLERSLEKINHNKERSSFVEVLPRPNRGAFEVFNNASTSLKISIHTVIQNSPENEDDLLSSDITHFRPINEKIENKLLGKYANGTTFVIPSTFDIPNYKRSESGSTYLDDEFGTSKKYQEYKKNYSLKEFILKFSVSLNDKACQTESEIDSAEENLTETNVMSHEDDLLFPGDNDLLVAELKQECTCSSNKDNAMNLEFSFGNEFDCPVHMARPDSTTAEIFGKSNTKCDHCNNNTWNSAVGSGSTEIDTEKTIKNIWNGGEFCLTCLGLNKAKVKPQLSMQQHRLREDVSHDGEQLLSDLSNVQKTYMEELPVSEVSCNITELLGAGERKRRHSLINTIADEHTIVPDSSFSFASRLEEDVLITMTAIPTLRSVTL